MSHGGSGGEPTTSRVEDADAGDKSTTSSTPVTSAKPGASAAVLRSAAQNV